MSVISTARQRDPLDVIIDSLSDPRCYHDNLVENVKQLLKLEGGSFRHNASRGKQVKRLVNMCMSTLTQWSKVHEIADSAAASNKVAQVSTPAPTSTTATTKLKTSARTLMSSNTLALAKNIPGIKARGMNTANGSDMKRIGSQTRALPVNRASKPKDQQTEADLVTGNWSPTADDTQTPCYDHIPKLVEISFLGVSTLESMGDSVATGLFDIEKARSNLITKTIEIGMVRSLEPNIFRRQKTISSLLLYTFIIHSEPY
jgi:hypothetical protein